ncbi:Ribosomal RNA-processing protein 1-like protein [Elsinoe fawcettii]|nr:Ribosomal RNA-processing protein 1-like protein [Elsinoe fawcettii]
MAPSPPSVPQGPLLQSLASSSLSRRRAAMSSLRTYLSSKSNFTQLDFLKLWKGLFYCLYMTPKMLHQQRLSIEISELVYALRSTSSVRVGEGKDAEEEQRTGKEVGGEKGKRKWEGNGPEKEGKRRRVDTPRDVDGEEGEGKVLGFIRAFWTTIAREWEGIDKARLDKFLFLVRRMVFVGFEGCKIPTSNSGARAVGAESEEDGEGAEEEDRYEWEEHLLDEYMVILKEIPLNAKDMKTSVGLKLHVLDVLVDEMDRSDTLRTIVTDKCTRLVEAMSKESMTKTIRKRAQEVLGDERLKDWSVAVQQDESEAEEEAESTDGNANGAMDGDDFEGFDD